MHRPLRRPIRPCTLTLLGILGALAVAPAGAQEVGANDFRISFQNGTGTATNPANWPAAAYQPSSDRYLVVWRAPATPGGLDEEVFGQLLTGTGELLGGAIQISDMGPPGDPSYWAEVPSVAANTFAGEFLVTWVGTDHTGGLALGERELYGQRVGGDGALLGPRVRLTDVGGTGDPIWGVIELHSVAYSPSQDEYLVVYSADDPDAGLVDGELEIFAQRLTAADLAEVGANDFRISDLGGLGVFGGQATHPAVAWNPTREEYLVVWRGFGEFGNANQEHEVYGQRLAADGTELGLNDFRISDLGPPGDPAYDAYLARVAYAPSVEEYLVVWYGDDASATQVDDELEVFGQRLAWHGAELGENDLRLSWSGPDGDTAYGAKAPVVAFDATADVFVVAWPASGHVVEGDDEVFVRTVSTGGALGGLEHRISDMGPPGVEAWDVHQVGIAAAPERGELLVVWSGEDDQGGLVDGEREIFGQRLVGTPPPAGATLLVDRADDDPTAWACDPAVARDCSLRGAIVHANGDPGADEITVSSAHHLLDPSLGELTVTEALVLAASPTEVRPRIRTPVAGWFGSVVTATAPLTARWLELEGGSGDRGGTIDAADSLTLVDTVVERGAAADQGGCLYAGGPLSLLRSEVFLCTVGNQPASVAAQGGCLYADGGATIIESSLGPCSVVAAPAATSIAGGAAWIRGGLELRRSAVLGADLLSIAPDDSRGGALYLSGGAAPLTATVENSSIALGAAWRGGGIWAAANWSLDVRDAWIGDNQAAARGGGFYLAGGDLQLVRSAVTGNLTDGGGGGAVATTSGSDLHVVNTTFSGNGARFGAAVELQGGSAELTHCTVVGPSGASTTLDGSGFTLRATAISGRCGDAVASAGDNFESPGATCGLGTASDHPATADLGLAPLASYSPGPSTMAIWAHRPLAGSALLDALAKGCPVDHDQWGRPRPMAGAPQCDAGALEGSEPPVVEEPLFADGFESGSTADWSTGVP